MAAITQVFAGLAVSKPTAAPVRAGAQKVHLAGSNAVSTKATFAFARSARRGQALVVRAEADDDASDPAGSSDEGDARPRARGECGREGRPMTSAGAPNHRSPGPEKNLARRTKKSSYFFGYRDRERPRG